MGILDIIEEAAGAFAADKALEAVDPNAGMLAKAAAAVAGFEGVAKAKEYLNKDDSEQVDTPPADDSSDDADAGA